MLQIRSYLNAITPVSDEDWEKICSRLVPKVFAKNELLVQEGAVCSEVYFIETGIIRLYVVTDGKEICRQFFFENNFFSVYESFLNQSPSKNFAGALEDTKVYSFSYADMQWFYQTIPSFQLIGRKIAEMLFLKISERVNSFLTESPDVRYRRLIESRPHVIQRIPQYMIASYLGITPEHLSRLRKKRSGNNGAH